MKVSGIIYLLFLFQGSYSQIKIKDDIRDAIKSQKYLEMAGVIDCNNTETTIGARVCANLAFQKEDSLMQIIITDKYNKLLKQKKKRSASKLISNQNAWIIYRNKKAKAVWNDDSGGNAIATAYLNTLVSLTKKRILFLRKS